MDTAPDTAETHPATQAQDSLSEISLKDIEIVFKDIAAMIESSNSIKTQIQEQIITNIQLISIDLESEIELLHTQKEINWKSVSDKCMKKITNELHPLWIELDKIIPPHINPSRYQNWSPFTTSISTILILLNFFINHKLMNHTQVIQAIFPKQLLQDDNSLQLTSLPETPVKDPPLADSAVHIDKKLVNLTTYRSIDMEFKRPGWFNINIYLASIIKACQIVSRFCITQTSFGNYSIQKPMRKLLGQVFGSFRVLNLKNGPLRRNYDSLKYTVQKLDDIIYDLTLRGLFPK